MQQIKTLLLFVWNLFSLLVIRIFLRSGILIFLVITSIIVFSLMSEHFLTYRNLINVLRQSVYLIIVSMGQMLVLLTAGFDLSVGTILALSSVVGAIVMSFMITMMPEALWLSISLGFLAGIAAGMFIGLINGIGVSLFNISPFIMTLGVSSMGFGLALYFTGGVPIYGIPVEYGDFFGYGTIFGIPVPVIVMLIMAISLYTLLNWTKFGRYIYAVGGNYKAASLSGINTKKVLLLVYVLCGFFASIAGMFLTARIGTGEANIGTNMPLESIAACVIAGVSLRGGTGRLEQVVLGAIFIILVQNGMNLGKIDSYLQIIVLGFLLVLAVAVDQIRLKFFNY